MVNTIKGHGSRIFKKFNHKNWLTNNSCFLNAWCIFQTGVYSICWINVTFITFMVFSSLTCTNEPEGTSMFHNYILVMCWLTPEQLLSGQCFSLYLKNQKENNEYIWIIIIHKHFHMSYIQGYLITYYHR